jgi:hypothetical protein
MRVYAFNQSLNNGDLVFSRPTWLDLKSKTHPQREAEAFFRNINESHPWTDSYLPYWKSPLFSLVSIYGNPFIDVGKETSITRELISQEAKNLIGDHIAGDGEFLKLELSGKIFESRRTKKGLFENHEILASAIKHPIPTGYYWFRITRYVEALRLENVLGFTHDPEWVSYLEKYDFHPEKLEGIYLFNISNPTHPGTFATGEFVDLVRKHDLKGLEFQLIWDSENADYVDERFKPEIWAEIKARHAKRN